MNIQVINISLYEVFRRYSSKYNIFRDLYDKNLSGLEIREIPAELCDKIQRLILEKNEICYKIPSHVSGSWNLLIIGEPAKFKELARKIVSKGDEDLGYKVSTFLRNHQDYAKLNFYIGDKQYPMSSSYVMGILNVTPDSFSDAGQFYDTQSAVDHGLEMLGQGADFLDIGGESTRPGSEPVTAEEELRRIIPVIEAILQRQPGTMFSVDTTKKQVAFEALKRGARIINDISGLAFEPDLAEVVKDFNATLVVMHMKGKPKDMQNNPEYEEVVSEVFDSLASKIQFAKKQGVRNIIVDPGIGFGKRVKDNFELIQRLDEFTGLGMPILIGVSRKLFIGKTIGADVTERDTASAITESIAVKNGARIIRTHNVKNAVQSKKILKCVFNPEEIINV